MPTVIPLPRLNSRRAMRDDQPRTPEHVAEEIAMRIGRGWLALPGTRLVGYCATSANCVEDLRVAKRYRRRGIGSGLLERALADLGAQAGREDFYEPTRQFFQRHGWRMIGAERQYFAAGRAISALESARALHDPATG